MTLYWTLYGALLVLGIATSGIFLAVHRPTQWRSMQAFDASFWVFMVFALYTWSFARFCLSLFTTGLPKSQSVGQVLVAMVFLVLFDLSLVVRLWHWLRFLKHLRRAAPLTDDGPSPQKQRGSYQKE